MRLNILTVTIVTLLVDFISGQFSFGNGFQASSSSFGNAGAQAPSNVNNFQGAGNRGFASNFNSNGQAGNAGGNAQGNYQMSGPNGNSGANAPRGNFGPPFRSSNSAGMPLQPPGNPQRNNQMASAGANGNFGGNAPNFRAPFNPPNFAGASQQRGNAFNNAQRSQGFPVNRPPQRPFLAAPPNQGPRGSAPLYANQPSQLNRNSDSNVRNPFPHSNANRNPNGFAVPQLDPTQKPPEKLLAFLTSMFSKPPNNAAASSNPQNVLPVPPPVNRPPVADPRQNRNQPLFNAAVNPVPSSNQDRIQNSDSRTLPQDSIAISTVDIFAEASPTASLPDGFLQDLLSGFHFGGMDISSIQEDKNSVTEGVSKPTESITGAEEENINDEDKDETCGEDEEWWDCIPLFHNTCENFARALARQDFVCKPGCFCRDGLIKTKDGECVEPDYCPDPICDSNEEETDCLNMCNTCEANCGLCSMLMCEPGCDCMDGFKRNENGTCIHASKCPPCTTRSPYISSASTAVSTDTGQISVSSEVTQKLISVDTIQQTTSSSDIFQELVSSEFTRGSTQVDGQDSLSVDASQGSVVTENTQGLTSVDATPGPLSTKSTQSSVLIDAASPPSAYATPLQSTE